MIGSCAFIVGSLWFALSPIRCYILRLYLSYSMILDLLLLKRSIAISRVLTSSTPFLLRNKTLLTNARATSFRRTDGVFPAHIVERTRVTDVFLLVTLAVVLEIPWIAEKKKQHIFKHTCSNSISGIYNSCNIK